MKLAGISWQTTFLRMIKWITADGKVIDVNLPIPYEYLYALIARRIDALDEITTPRLVHRRVLPPVR